MTSEIEIAEHCRNWAGICRSPCGACLPDEATALRAALERLIAEVRKNIMHVYAGNQGWGEDLDAALVEAEAAIRQQATP